MPGSIPMARNPYPPPPDFGAALACVLIFLFAFLLGLALCTLPILLACGGML